MRKFGFVSSGSCSQRETAHAGVNLKARPAKHRQRVMTNKYETETFNSETRCHDRGFAEHIVVVCVCQSEMYSQFTVFTR